jgi:hypothetical protein
VRLARYDVLEVQQVPSVRPICGLEATRRSDDRRAWWDSRDAPEGSPRLRMSRFHLSNSAPRSARLSWDTHVRPGP